MGTIRVHEFTTLDGVIDAPTWAGDYPFDPRMGEAIGSLMGGCKAILLGRYTFEMFAPAWSQRTAAEDPGAPFMNDSPKYVVAATPPSVEWANTSSCTRSSPVRARGCSAMTPPRRSWSSRRASPTSEGSCASPTAFLTAEKARVVGSVAQ